MGMLDSCKGGAALRPFDRRRGGSRTAPTRPREPRVVGLPYDIESAATSVSHSRDPRNSLEAFGKR